VQASSLSAVKAFEVATCTTTTKTSAVTHAPVIASRQNRSRRILATGTASTPHAHRHARPRTRDSIRTSRTRAYPRANAHNKHIHKDAHTHTSAGTPKTYACAAHAKLTKKQPCRTLCSGWSNCVLTVYTCRSPRKQGCLPLPCATRVAKFSGLLARVVWDAHSVVAHW